MDLSSYDGNSVSKREDRKVFRQHFDVTFLFLCGVPYTVHRVKQQKYKDEGGLKGGTAL